MDFYVMTSNENIFKQFPLRETESYWNWVIFLMLISVCVTKCQHMTRGYCQFKLTNKIGIINSLAIKE